MVLVTEYCRYYPKYTKKSLQLPHRRYKESKRGSVLIKNRLLIIKYDLKGKLLRPWKQNVEYIVQEKSTHTHTHSQKKKKKSRKKVLSTLRISHFIILS